MSDRWQCERCEDEFEWLTDFRAHKCEPLLTVADVLKHNLDAEVECAGFILCWNRKEKLWRIWQNTQFVFESPDESAACAEFLRLTTNPNE